ncbi:MAG: hypothetical protein JSU70_01085 [Phycisphaerales bacterium]|nr:MAG: hypothetical protein JSU70_01085 [Phycisphaerales bacterium]
MVRKDIRRSLSGGALVLCVVVFCVLGPDVQAAFEAQEITFTISGNVGQAGVVMQGLPGQPVTSDNNGSYTATLKYGWKGTVTPEKAGYTFEPPSRSYSKVTADQANQDYTANILKFVISGTTGLAGVVIKGLPGEPVSDQTGAYAATVEYGWSGTAAPETEGYTFEPASKAYNQVASSQTNQNYAASRVTFTITGSVGEDGVTMRGLPNNPVTSGGGSYSASVPYGWSGMVTPTKPGYTFEPTGREYKGLTGAQTNQNYTATVLTFSISGSAGMAGVEMQGLPNNPITDVNGAYSAVVPYGWTDKVTPKLAGYTFEPPSKNYTKITGGFENQNYLPTLIKLTISGAAGQPGVVMRGLPGDPVANQNGAYTATVDYGWSGTVTPDKEGFNFSPPNRVYSSVTDQQVSQDYTAQRITFVVSGSVGQPGVLMDGLPKRPVSGANGSYSTIVDYGWSGKVTPRKAGYEFNPPSREYKPLASAQTNQDYTAAPVTYTISGKIISKDGPVEGVLMMTTLGGPTGTTSASGEYSLEVRYGWRGPVTPAKEGYTFTPKNRTYEPVSRDQTSQGFAGEVIMLSISGAVILGGTPIEGVLISADNKGTSDTTDAKGRYTIKVPFGWSGKVTPTKEGLVFTPAYKEYVNVTEDVVETGGEPPPAATTPPPTTAERPTVPVDPSRLVPRPVERITPTEVPQPTVGPNDLDAQKTALEREVESLRAKIDKLLQEGPEGQIPSGTAAEPLVTRIPEEPLIIKAPGEPFTTRVPHEGRSGLISATFTGTDLRAALRELATQSGVDIYADPTVKGAPVTAELKQATVEAALQTILKGTGYVAKEIPNSYLVYRPISNVFSDNELRQALQDIATSAGVTIIVGEDVAGLVTGTLDAVPLDTALEIVLAGTGYVVTKTPYYYLVSSGDPQSAAFSDVSQTRRMKMKYADGEDVVALLSPAFTQYVKGDANDVLITAPPAMADRIQADVEELDQRPRHVMLDARIVVLERGDLLNMGIEWGWPSVSAGTFSNSEQQQVSRQGLGAAWPWGIQIGYTPDGVFTNALELTLNLLAENSEARITSQPQVMAQDGKQAQIQVVTEEYFYLTAPEQTNLFYTSSQLETVKSGTTLTITPRIGDNNDITLEVAVEVSDSIPRGRGNDLPVVTRRTARNVVRIQDGGTVTVAGLTENRRRLKEKRVPGLSSLPLLGHLFNYTEDDNASREIAVFITARIVESGKKVAGQPVIPAPTQAANQPAGDEFRANLQESIVRLSR